MPGGGAIGRARENERGDRRSECECSRETRECEARSVCFPEEKEASPAAEQEGMLACPEEEPLDGFSNR